MIAYREYRTIGLLKGPVSPKIIPLWALSVILWLASAASLHADEPIVFTTGEFPPYVGAALPGKGPHAIAIEQVFARAGIKVVIEVLPWQRAYSEAATGKNVGSFPWLKTAEREVDLIYPERFIENFNDVMFYRTERFPNGLTITSLEELAKSRLRVVGVASYWYVDKLRALGANLDIVFAPDQAYARLENNLADIHINVDKVGKMELKQFLGDEVAKQFTAAPHALQVAPGYLAFSRKHPRAQEMLNIWERFGKSLLPLTN